ncbi:MAG: hypothetical protein ACKO04_07285 [Actinomycetes bacterium]
MAAWWQTLRSRWFADPSTLAGARTTGAPRSSNGASSFHLRWDLYSEFDEVSVVLEVVEPPTVDWLYFWALQADFGDATGRRAGGAHLGLQWHPEYPGGTAVNWGGYDARGGVLHGSRSTLPSALGNPHTHDFPWLPRRPYRLTIARAASPGPHGGPAWTGAVTDLGTGTTTVVRELYPDGDRVVGVVMWSEVFAHCDHPGAAVRWSAPRARTVDGVVVAPAAVLLNYQTHADGGCANTSSEADGAGVVQRTNTVRVHPTGTRLALPATG